MLINPLVRLHEIVTVTNAHRPFHCGPAQPWPGPGRGDEPQTRGSRGQGLEDQGHPGGGGLREQHPAGQLVENGAFDSDKLLQKQPLLLAVVDAVFTMEG